MLASETGAPPVYRDASVWLIPLVAAVCCPSLERIPESLARHNALSEAVGYDQFDEQGRRRTVSPTQCSHCLKELGLLPSSTVLRGHTSPSQRRTAGDPNVCSRTAALPHAFMSCAPPPPTSTMPTWASCDVSCAGPGQASLAERSFIRQWRDLMGPRANIDVHFAWMKGNFGLQYFRAQGDLAISRFVFQIYIAALIAVCYQRSDLSTCCLTVLAFTNT